MDNKNLTQTGFVYKGEVKISAGKHDYRYKNQGTSDLFQLFCRWLSGYYTGDQKLHSAYLPHQIMIESLDKKRTELLKSKLPCEVEYKYISGIPYAVVLCNIPFDMWNKPSDNPEQLKLCLYDAQTSPLELANTHITAEPFKKLIPGRSISIEWRLTLGNGAIDTTSTGGST